MSVNSIFGMHNLLCYISTKRPKYILSRSMQKFENGGGGVIPPRNVRGVDSPSSPLQVVLPS